MFVKGVALLLEITTSLLDLEAIIFGNHPNMYFQVITNEVRFTLAWDKFTSSFQIFLVSISQKCDPIAVPSAQST